MNHKFYHKCGRNVGTVAQAGTISAYPSLSEGILDKNWNECGHDRRSWHYLGFPFTIKKKFWTNLCKVDVLRSRIGPSSSNVGLIGSEFGPKFNKVGTIESGFGTTCNKVDTIKYPHQTKRALSRPKLNEN